MCVPILARNPVCPDLLSTIGSLTYSPPPSAQIHIHPPSPSVKTHPHTIHIFVHRVVELQPRAVLNGPLAAPSAREISSSCDGCELRHYARPDHGLNHGCGGAQFLRIPA
ncbi:hypothetical protein TorRG33x02_293940 [Trema orientale]|uniref:Uncharacterized protein n=1 Tax=Trema orientale TaxID=63057 RepID=A0A2P5C8I0_TREOI|nr:hypothetical protein TorRG33x02_293940 [Trema orientale]